MGPLRVMLLSLALGLAACASSGPSRDLVDHPSLAVSGPATAGYLVGSVVGVPVMIAALPVTLAIRFAVWLQAGDDTNADEVIVLPQVACAKGFSYAVGGLPWLIVGDPPPPARAPAMPVE